MIHELDPMGVDNLRVAVVEQASKDYLKALLTIKNWSRAVLRGKKISRSTKAKLTEPLATIGECEVFFRKYISFWVEVDGWSIRNELLRQSGINETLLEQIREAYNTKEESYESETGVGVRGSDGTEDVPRQQGGKDLHVPNLSTEYASKWGGGFRDWNGGGA